MLEVNRRIVLAAGVAATVWLALAVRMKPFAHLERPDFAQEQAREGGFLVSEEERYLRQLPIEDYVEAVTLDKVVPIDVARWKSLIDLLDTPAAQLGRRRLSPDDAASPGAGGEARPRWIFAEPDLPPINELLSRLREERELYLRPAGAGAGEFVRLRYQTLDWQGTAFGSSPAFYPSLPASMLHPMRGAALIVGVLVLLAYLLWPPLRRAEGELHHGRWLISWNDIAWLILFVPFLGLPMLLSGGSQMALTHGIFFTIFLWPLALLATWILRWAAWYATHGLLVTDSEVSVRSIGGRWSAAYSEIASAQRVTVRPPRWLSVFLWLGALAGRGASSARMAGQALMLEGSETSGLELSMVSGGTRYLWGAGAGGESDKRSVDRLEAGLRSAGIALPVDPKVIRGLGLPAGHDPTLPPSMQGTGWIWMLLLTPFAVVALLTLGSGVLMGDSGAADGGHPRAAGTTGSSFQGASPLWEWRYRVREDSRLNFGTAVAPVDGGALVGGSAESPADRTDFFVLRLDAEGAVLWQASAGTEDVDDLIAVVPVAGGGCIGVGQSRPLSSLLGTRAPLLVRFDAVGTSVWLARYPDQGAEAAATDARVIASGNIEVLLVSEGGAAVLEIDSAGHVLGLAESLDLVGDGVSLERARFDESGGIVAVGSVGSSAIDSRELLMCRWDESGQQLWQLACGGPRDQSGRDVALLADGGCVAVGVTSSGGKTGDELYVARASADGKLVWDGSWGGRFEQQGSGVTELADGSIAAVGITRDEENWPHGYLVLLDAHGALLGERRYGAPGVADEATAVAQLRGGELWVVGSHSDGDPTGNELLVLSVSGTMGVKRSE